MTRHVITAAGVSSAEGVVEGVVLTAALEAEGADAYRVERRRRHGACRTTPDAGVLGMLCAVCMATRKGARRRCDYDASNELMGVNHPEMLEQRPG